jgi:hypothetical protein
MRLVLDVLEQGTAIFAANNRNDGNGRAAWGVKLAATRTGTDRGREPTADGNRPQIGTD